MRTELNSGNHLPCGPLAAQHSAWQGGMCSWEVAWLTEELLLMDRLL